MTAKTRLLASDLTTPGLLDPTQVAQISFPSAGSSVSDPTVRETKLRTDVYTQVLDVENLSRSRWDQVDELEAIERGEFTRGREVVRLVSAEGEEQTQQPPPPTAPSAALQQGGLNHNVHSDKNATHRLVLQDCRGHKIYALELTRIPKIVIGTTNIGEKILLKKGTVVARGTVMLEPTTCEILGGKVEAWQKAWTEGRLARLKEAVCGGEGAN